MNINNLNIEELNREKYKAEMKLQEMSKNLEAKKRELLASKDSMPDYLQSICDILLKDNVSEEELKESLTILEQKQIELDKIAQDCLRQLQAAGVFIGGE